MSKIDDYMPQPPARVTAPAGRRAEIVVGLAVTVVCSGFLALAAWMGYMSIHNHLPRKNLLFAYAFIAVSLGCAWLAGKAAYKLLRPTQRDSERLISGRGLQVAGIFFMATPTLLIYPLTRGIPIDANEIFDSLFLSVMGYWSFRAGRNLRGRSKSSPKRPSTSGGM